jgi:hypothetical protein
LRRFTTWLGAFLMDRFTGMACSKTAPYWNQHR